VPVVKVESSAEEELEALPLKIRLQIGRKIQALGMNPHPSGSKKLNGEFDGRSPVYRFRSGDYRVLYVVFASGVSVFKVAHRREVYR
jgi:mRNA interferase RelE/StbE